MEGRTSTCDLPPRTSRPGFTGQTPVVVMLIEAYDPDDLEKD
jgi:hypothetical protein